ncbi:2-hydroxyacid dehydrogenase homolog [Zophobas morio]|uniref:2-hydroxyacid dehydrogenase homolog n=1 Tax=Zophobas morio TaxID=2755281 RepID=UPI0030834876
MSNEILSRLKSGGCFSDLNSEMLSAIASKVTQVNLKSEEFLFKQGDQTGSLYIVGEGVLTVTVSSKVQQDVKVNELGVNDFAGLGSFFEETEHSASVLAKTDALIYKLTNSDFQSLITQHPSIAYSMLRYFSKTVKKLRAGLVQHSTKPSQKSSSTLKVAVFDTKNYDIESFQRINSEGKYNYEFNFLETRLSIDTANLAQGCEAVCVFVNDDVGEEVVKILARMGVKLIALRCAGFNNVALGMAAGFGISVVRVPAYSPYAVAEFATALLLTLNRKIHRAYNRVRDGDFSLSGLVGNDLHGKTVGVIGTGKIGQVFVDIMLGFGCRVLCYDVYRSPEIERKADVKYTSLDQLYAASDVISLHVPLLDSTRYIINKESISKMKKGVIIINTSRGGLVKTTDLIEALKSGQVKGAGLDVYENESGYFFENRGEETITDDILSLLLSLNNVILTSHQAFLTKEAISNISSVTLESLKEFASGKTLKNLTYYVGPQGN